MLETTVREMRAADCVDVSALLPDLGYSATARELRDRMNALRGWPHQQTFVALHEHAIVGFCHIQGVPLIVTAGYTEIQALVVATRSRRQGVGKALLGRAVRWSIANRYDRIRLRSGLHRDDAHAFYEACGFTRQRASYAFEMIG